MIEVVSIMTAVGVGHLTAGLFAPISSPYQAVADTVVRLSPAWLTEFGKALDFPGVGLPAGVADKVLLLVGIGVALLALGVLAGLVAHRSRSTGRAVIIGLGLVGLAAVCFSPVFSLIDLVAPLAALLAGLSAYFRLYNLAEQVAAPPAPGREWKTEVSRRSLMVRSAVLSAGAVGAGIGGQLMGAGIGTDTAAREAAAPRLRPAEPLPPLPPVADFAAVGTPDFITPNADFYRIDVALRIPTVSAQDYRLRVRGMVERELSFSYDDLLNRPLEERRITLTCVSNEVNGNLISNASWVGVSLRDLLLEAGVRPGADQLFSTSADGWTCGTPIDVLLEPDRGAMLALAMNGEPLPLIHGYPVRMVVPGLYGFVSATKWLADLEVTTFDRRRAYWLERGWAQKAPIKTQSRIDRPRGLETVPAGRVTAAGIAWAQHRGISRVEVRVDGGPWQDAQLSTEVSQDTWRMWRTELTVPPGNHFIESRATDATGAVQTERRTEPIPDGASGWPMINFTAR
jgi:DMSO/TMAO reductase YedYZ molybdopterin-dependent catalytic subunit